MKRPELNTDGSNSNDKDYKLNSWVDKVSDFKAEEKQSKESKVDSWVDKVHDFKPEERNSLFKEFSQNTTVHGLQRTTDARHGRFRRGFWIVVFTSMLASLLYTVIFQVMCMMSYPTITQQSLQFRRKLPFPAVTLCNLNRFKKSKMVNSVSSILLATSILSSHINISWNDPIWNFTYSAEESAWINTQVQHFAHNLDETLQICTWNNKPYKCSEIFVTQKTDFGMCYTFNGLIDVNTTLRETVHGGSKYGLTVVVDIQQEEYLIDQNTDAAGLRVLLHDPGETPLVEGKGFDVGPGTATKASIKMIQVTNLPPPYTAYDGTECTALSTISHNRLQYFDRYDPQACIYECRLNYIAKTCGCRSVFDPGNYTICHPRVTLECYGPQFERFTLEGKDKECSCPIPCKIKLFDAEVSMSAYPSSALTQQVNEIWKVNLTETQLRRNSLKLTLAYDRLMVEQITQVSEFNFENIMSTFGGQLGIYIGASMISLLEFCEFGLELLVFQLLRLRKKPKPQES